MRKAARILSGIFAVVLLAALFCGCGDNPAATTTPPPAIDPEVLRAGNTWNKHIVDTAVSLLQSGYMVIRRGLGADSYMLAEMNTSDKTYSHCGIVMIEQGYPFVYHSIGGEDNPDERLRRDSANFFFSPLHNTHLGIVEYDMSPASVEELGRVVRQFYNERPKFDMKFELATDDKLYCSEFIFKALNKAMKDTAYMRPGYRLGHKYIAIDDLFMNAHARVIWQVKFK